MKINTKLLRGGLLTTALTALTFGSVACSGVGVGVRVSPGLEIAVASGPPPPRPEVIRVEAPTHRHVWVDGFWDWDPRRQDWVWIPGGWVRPPRGHYNWVPPTYERRGEGWITIRGHWD